MPLLYILSFVILSVMLFISAQVIRMRMGRSLAEAENSSLRIGRIKNFGSVRRLSITPLIDFHAPEGYDSEEGVSYLVKADDTTILFDLGYNKKGEHPSPLVRNMERLKIDLCSIDIIFISHGHMDHVGGRKAESGGEFMLSAGPVKLRGIPAYAPPGISASGNNPDVRVVTVKEPAVMGEGIASIGVYSRSLFLIGYTTEQTLAVNVKGKGIVLVAGCGHQGVGAIIERAKQLFDEPIYGIIGGLHLPVNGGRVMMGPLNMQNIVGVDRSPLSGIRECDVDSAVTLIESLSPGIVAISPHDSSDWAIGRFREYFGSRFREIRVGEEIKI